MAFLCRKPKTLSQGSAAILALIVMLLLGVMGGAFIAVSSSETSFSGGYRDGVAAQYLAEAGALYGLTQLKKNSAYLTNGFTSGIKNAGTPTAGTYYVTVTGSGNTRTITSIGTVTASGAKRQVVWTYTVPQPANGPYPAYSGNLLTVNSGVTVIGGQIATCSDSNKVTNNSNLPVAVNVDPVAIATEPPQFWQQSNYWGYPILSGTPNSMTLSGNYYVNGDFNVNGGVTLTVAAGQQALIYVKKNANLNGAVTVNSGGKLTIICDTFNLNSGIYNIKGDLAIYAMHTININTSLQSSSPPPDANILLLSSGDINLNSGTIKRVYATSDHDINMNSGVYVKGLLECSHWLTLNGGTIEFDASIKSYWGY